MREIKYIVPPGLEGVKVSDDVIKELRRRCASESHRTRVVLLGVFDGLVCVSWEGGNLPRYANSPIVFTIDKNNHVKELSTMSSMRIINKALRCGVDAGLFRD